MIDAYSENLSQGQQWQICRCFFSWYVKNIPLLHDTPKWLLKQINSIKAHEASTTQCLFSSMRKRHETLQQWTLQLSWMAWASKVPEIFVCQGYQTGPFKNVRLKQASGTYISSLMKHTPTTAHFKNSPLLLITELLFSQGTNFFTRIWSYLVELFPQTQAKPSKC